MRVNVEFVGTLSGDVLRAGWSDIAVEGRASMRTPVLLAYACGPARPGAPPHARRASVTWAGGDPAHVDACEVGGARAHAALCVLVPEPGGSSAGGGAAAYARMVTRTYIGFVLYARTENEMHATVAYPLGAAQVALSDFVRAGRAGMRVVLRATTGRGGDAAPAVRARARAAWCIRISGEDAAAPRQGGGTRAQLRTWLALPAPARTIESVLTVEARTLRRISEDAIALYEDIPEFPGIAAPVADELTTALMNTRGGLHRLPSSLVGLLAPSAFAAITPARAAACVDHALVRFGAEPTREGCAAGHAWLQGAAEAYFAWRDGDARAREVLWNAVMAAHVLGAAVNEPSLAQGYLADFALATAWRGARAVAAPVPAELDTALGTEGDCEQKAFATKDVHMAFAALWGGGAPQTPASSPGTPEWLRACARLLGEWVPTTDVMGVNAEVATRKMMGGGSGAARSGGLGAEPPITGHMAPTMMPLTQLARAILGTQSGAAWVESAGGGADVRAAVALLTGRGRVRAHTESGLVALAARLPVISLEPTGSTASMQAPISMCGAPRTLIGQLMQSTRATVRFVGGLMEGRGLRGGRAIAQAVMRRIAPPVMTYAAVYEGADAAARARAQTSCCGKFTVTIAYVPHALRHPTQPASCFGYGVVGKGIGVPFPKYIAGPFGGAPGHIAAAPLCVWSREQVRAVAAALQYAEPVALYGGLRPPTPPTTIAPREMEMLHRVASARRDIGARVRALEVLPTGTCTLRIVPRTSSGGGLGGLRPPPLPYFGGVLFTGEATHALGSETAAQELLDVVAAWCAGARVHGALITATPTADFPPNAYRATPDLALAIKLVG